MARERTKTLPFPSESHDEPSPVALTTAERENIYLRLQELSNISTELERRIDKLEISRKDSVPVTITGKGFSIIGNWRVVVFLAVLAALVYLVPQYLPGN